METFDLELASKINLKVFVITFMCYIINYINLNIIGLVPSIYNRECKEATPQ